MTAAGKRARIEAFIGQSGSGKGLAINRRLDELRPPRLLIWDPRNEYAARAGMVQSLAALVEVCKRAGPDGPLRVRYVLGARTKPGDAFGAVCEVAFIAGNLVFLADELGDVTTASYAPPDWRRVITQGRHRGLHILGAAQRPALIDKTFIANCTRVRCASVGYDDDRRAMARHLRVTEPAIDALRMIDDPLTLDYIEADRATRTITAGTYTLKRGRIVEVRAPYDPASQARNVVPMVRKGRGPM